MIQNVDTQFATVDDLIVGQALSSVTVPEPSLLFGLIGVGVFGLLGKGKKN
ncbi:MAG: PEP-CTERM sorting domain-containing protein [Cyanobacterium sp. T60_A2020_053]|nr:PEP-CTERM sorting domain-containing protein [Cyanobacterium sp. T60_A2020_053]